MPAWPFTKAFSGGPLTPRILALKNCRINQAQSGAAARARCCTHCASVPNADRCHPLQAGCRFSRQVPNSRGVTLGKKAAAEMAAMRAKEAAARGVEPSGTPPTFNTLKCPRCQRVRSQGRSCAVAAGRGTSVTCNTLVAVCIVACVVLQCVKKSRGTSLTERGRCLRS